MHLKKGTIKAKELLEKSLSTGDFVYTFSKDKTIQLERKEILSTNTNAALQQPINGKVVDENGVPLAGATIYVSTHSLQSQDEVKDFLIRGTQTDFDGEFTVEASIGEHLSVSFIGYEFYSQEITSLDADFTIILKEAKKHFR